MVFKVFIWGGSEEGDSLSGMRVTLPYDEGGLEKRNDIFGVGSSRRSMENVRVGGNQRCPMTLVKFHCGKGMPRCGSFSRRYDFI